MRRWWTFLTLVLFPLVVSAQYVVETFDEPPADPNYWNHVTSEHADTTKSYVHVSYVNDPVKVGTGAMRLDYSAHNIESWGGFAKIEHWYPDSTKTYDFSLYDTLTIWYYNVTPASEPGRIHLRIQFYDVSDAVNGANTYDANQTELWYSFHYVLDDQPGWHQIRMLMVDARTDPTLDEWGGDGFNLTGWAGITGNNQLDLDRIKGFGFEFSVSGGGEGDYVYGTIVLDHMELRGTKHVAYVFFNGKTVSPRLQQFTWGQSSLELVEGAGTDGSNALKWTQGDEWGNGWTGAGWNIDPPMDMSSIWDTDSLKFRMKTDQGVGALRVQLEDGQNKVGQVFQPADDGEWHDYTFKLSEMAYQDNSPSFDSSHVTVLQFMAEGTGQAGKVIWIDYLWTDNPEIDITPPAAPTGVGAMAQQYYNLVYWQDVPGESGEKYNVYASTKPITDLNDPEVDLIAFNVGEDVQSAVHYLYYPLEDREVQYYYAVECIDEAGNVGPIGVSETATTNTAKGIATISLTPPADFAADGDLSEWDASGIRPFTLKPETDYVVVGDISDSTDLMAKVYIAMDDNYMYVAGDVTDDVYHFGEGNWWEQDAFQFFIGLYDWRGPKHTAYQRGEEPDYSIIFLEGEVFAEATHHVLGTSGDENYFFTDLGGSDYIFEARIPFDTLAICYNANDKRFHPLRGMRIPLELYFHDNDGQGWEGNLGRSPYNTDHGWQNPAEWEYTWIGDTTHVLTSVAENRPGVPLVYALEQNYPNPFNPTTTIAYSIAKAGQVRIDLYNALGQKVKTLVNGYKPAGRYQVTVDASSLSSGIYFYRIESGSFHAVRKMVLMK